MDQATLLPEDFLHLILEKQGSDVYIVPGAKVMAKIGDQLEPLSADKLRLAECEQLIRQIYTLADDRPIERLIRDGDDDFSFGLARLGRFRCNAFKQRGTLAAILRVVPFQLPDAAALHIPDAVLNLSTRKRGMVLVTGPAGSGKTTTLACIIDRINEGRGGHIITLEDPIEYIHPHKKSLVTQREIENDTKNFAHALRASLRQAPDVILLGEMRDFETIQTALTAAETGHLLLSTLHTLGAGKTIDRIVDVFPASQQQQVRIQLSMVLQAVVSQQLIPTLDGRIVPAFEVMLVNSAISNMIRENKVQQIDNAIFAGAGEGMLSMDSDILRLFREGRITRENALLYAVNPDVLAKRMKD
ncbi:MAG: PilT/PilU family type 4a pilus ATPase [Candidatus Limiplasma sp.]|nr:PilT/PilU family type 4a pilus ATPase [Candidatus Limiplasma sp.]